MPFLANERQLSRPRGVREWRRMVMFVLVGIAGQGLIGWQPVLFTGSATAAAPDEEVPPEYKMKAIPPGWRDDPKIRAAGQEVFEGKTIPEVNCARCHGNDGKPTRVGKGAPDFSDPAESNKHSDAHWFWRLTEKKSGSKMPGYKDKLTEEQRWQVIAYVRALAQKAK